MRNRQGGGHGRRWGWLVAAILAVAGGLAQAGTTQLTVSAAVLSKGNCKFQTAPATLNFGMIDPTSGANATALTTIQFKCVGSVPNVTYSLQAGDGLNATGPGMRRVKNTATGVDYMAYSLSLSPASGTIPKNFLQTVTVSGTILPADFQNARAGAYSDTVVLSLNP